MVSKKVTIVNAEGMHMRPAGLIAKAVMQIMAAGLKKGTEVEICVSGGDEQAVLDELAGMFEDGFGE